MMTITKKRCFLWSWIVGAGLLLSVSIGHAKTKNVLPEVAEAARQFASLSGPEAWESGVEIETADWITFLGPDRVLVSTMAVSSKVGTPVQGPLLLLDAGTGSPLWSASRSALPSGQYVLMAQKPLLILNGRDDKMIETCGLNPATGGRQWKIRTPHPAEVKVEGSSLLILSETERTLRCLDVNSGKETWKQVLPEKVVVPGVLLAVSDDAVFIIGPRVIAFNMMDGKQRWMVDRASHTCGPNPLMLPSGMILWGPRGVGLVDTANGVVKWEYPSPVSHSITAVQADAGFLCMVLSGPATADDTIVVLNALSGKKRWSNALKDDAASQPIMHGDLVYISGDSAVMAWRKTNGKKVFRSSFSPAFRSARPSAAKLISIPDQLMVRGSKIVVWRQSAGLQAFALASGKALWTQGPYDKEPVFAADQAALLIKTTKETLQVQQDAYTKRLNGMQGGMQDLQRQAENAGTQQASYAASALSMVSIAQVWREARRQAENQGLAQRFILMADAYLRRFESAVQGRYFIDPFIAKGVGRGVTVVDLDSGLRSDFLYAPLVAPLLDYSMDLLAFTMDPSQKRLLAVGVGFKPERHKPMRKWGCLLPQPSLFAFDMEKLHFETRNVMREKATSITDKLLMQQLGSGPEAFLNAAAGGLVTPVRIFLDNGADLNTVYSSGGQTALHLAAFNGHLEVVELLIKRGADINRKDGNGKTPLDYAMMLGASESADAKVRRQTIADMLRAAGGIQETGPVTKSAGPASRLHTAIRSGDEQAFMAALNQGASVDGVFDHETPLTLALRERRTNMVAELRRRGCSLTVPGAYGLTPLHYAAMQLDLELINACLSAKADVNAASTRGETPLMAIIRPYAPFGGDPMLKAVELLLTNGADPNRKEVNTEKQTLLQVAKAMDRQLAKLLVRYGAK